MKKVGIILMLSMLFAYNSRAQLNFTDSTKNEIGMNINPILDILGISANTDNLSIQFKHHYSNLSLRLGLSLLNSNTFRTNDPRNYQFKLNDSVTVFDHSYDFKNSIKMHIGLEQQQMLKNKWKFFYGFDILGGYSGVENRIERTFYHLKADSSFSYYLTNDDSIISTKDHILLGAAFVGGLDYFFSKTISAGIQGYFPIVYEFETGDNMNKSSSINFEQTFSIVVRIHL